MVGLLLVPMSIDHHLYDQLWLTTLMEIDEPELMISISVQTTIDPAPLSSYLTLGPYTRLGPVYILPSLIGTPHVDVPVLVPHEDHVPCLSTLVVLAW
jgi:hypothetical protein